MQGGRGGCWPGHLDCEVITRFPLGLLLQSLRGSARGLLGPLEDLMQPPISWLQLAESQVSPGHCRSSCGDSFCVVSWTDSWAGSRPPQSSALWCVMGAVDTLFLTAERGS